MMRIGINLLYLLPGIVGGTEVYAAGLLRGLAQIDSENEYIVFLNQESGKFGFPDSPRVRRIICPVRAECRPCRYAWEQLALPWQLHRHRIDLIHSLGYVTPLVAPCLNVVTIPDLNYLALKDYMPRGKLFFLRFFSMQSARRSTHIITISEFSKREIIRRLGISSDKVTVTHLGPGWTQSNGISWETLQGHYGLSQPYIVAFGGGSAHKNISRLLTAFREVCMAFPHSLVLIGRLPPDLDLNTELAEQERNRVVALGHIPADHIRPILRHADLFVLPSLYEGFGLPVLEAQQAGVAVACSTAASLPEVAGDGAVFFDPLSVDSMVSVMRQCLSLSSFRSQLQRLGQENVRRFSWAKTAQETLAIYRQVYATCTC